jgi:hypothetical protein
MFRYGTGWSRGTGRINSRRRSFEMVVEQLDAQEGSKKTRISVLLFFWRVYQLPAATSR